MAIVRMTSEEIREKHPLTPEKIKAMHEYYLTHIEKIEADDDPDSPDISELLEKGLVRRVTHRTHAAPETSKVPFTIYIEPTILASFRKKSGKNWKNLLNSGAETWLRQAAMA